MKARTLVVLLLLMTTCLPLVAYDVSDEGPTGFIKKTREFREDTAKVRLLALKGLDYVIKNDSIAREYLDSALMICHRNRVEIPAEAHFLDAECSFSAGDFQRASEEASAALSLSEGTKNYRLNVMICLFLGKCNNRTGLYKESIDYYDRAIAVSEKNNLKGFISKAYVGKSEVYGSLNDIGKQRESFERMIEAGRKEKNMGHVIEGYYRYGTSYCGDSANVPARNFLKADSLLKKCISYASGVGDSIWMAGAMANAGWNFYLQNKYDSAIYYYEKSLKYGLNTGYNYTSVNSYGNLGTIYRDLHKYGQALAYYNKAIDRAKLDPDNETRNLWWIYQDMSKLYLSLNDTAKAFTSYVLFKKYSDIQNKKESSRGLSDARVRYEAESHRKEVELLSLRLKNNRLLNIGFSGLIVLLLAIGVLLMRSNRLRNKRRISEMNRKIAEVTQANLRQQMNPHFIFNTLNSIQYYMYQHDKLATNNYLTKFSTLMRKVLDNSRHTSVPLSDELSALNLYLELECIRFKDKFDFSIVVDDEIDPLMYKVPTMLIQPYVENSITHGLMPLEGKGSVRIDIRMNENCLLCTIEDNGIGRKAAMERSRLREPNHNSLGTQITESRLDLVNSLYGTSLKTQYTDLTNEKGEPTGTRVEIHIPLLA